MAHPIQVVVLNVSSESGTCPGHAHMRSGETFVFDARTPEGEGLCINSFNALLPLAMAMRLADKVEEELQDYVDLVCPHGRVTYRISRLEEA